MMEEFMEILKGLVLLLEEEKQALIKNNGNRVGEIVAEKGKYIDRLAQFKGLDIEKDEEAMELVGEINSLQELNLLLTNQALTHQNSILESIINNVNKLANTYSAKGSYEKENSINIIDQSV